MAKKIIPPVIQYVKDANGAFVKPDAQAEAPKFVLKDFLFDKQLRFVEDPRPYKIAVCSRRSGKTVACAAHLIDVALTCKEVVCLYITLARNNAKKLIWPEIQKINRNYKLGGIPDETELSMKFPNGSIIYCSGAKDKSEIEKFRGLALKLCYIDECQSFRDYIEELVDDVISPALLDYAGTLCLIGTPGPIPVGFFAECAGAVKDKQYKAEAWSHHFWTFFDNPHIELKSGKTHQELLNRELRRRGVSMADPSIQREFFGKWEFDGDSLWIKYRAEMNHYDDAPTLPAPHKWNYIMGIDLGFNDADAIGIIAWSETTPITYLIEEEVMAKQGITELVEAVKRFQTKYEISKMVIDEGGLGKKIAEEMRRRHAIPVQMADKARKQENAAFLNDALKRGHFKAKVGSRFAQDCMRVEIDRSKSRPDKIKVSDRYHSDIIDAVLYAFKESPAFSYEPPEDKPKRGTKEWAQQQSKQMFEAAQEHFGRQAEMERRISGQEDPES